MISTEALEKTAVTSRFCLKALSVRVREVTPSLQLTKKYPSAGTAVTVTDWSAVTLKLRDFSPEVSPLVRVPPV